MVAQFCSKGACLPRLAGISHLKETVFCGYHSECVLCRAPFSEQSLVVGVGLRELTLFVAFSWTILQKGDF